MYSGHKSYLPSMIIVFYVTDFFTANKMKSKVLNNNIIQQLYSIYNSGRILSCFAAC